MNLHDIKNQITQSWTQTFSHLAESLPDLVAALILLLVGILVASLIRQFVAKGLKKLKLDCAAEHFHLPDRLASIGVKVESSQLIAKLFYWLIIFFTLMSVANFLGLTGFVTSMQAVAAYIPNLLAALIILGVGLWLAHFARNALKEVFKKVIPAVANIVSNFLYGLLLVVIVLTVLEQLSFDTGFIQTLLLIVFAGFAISVAIAVGLGSAPQLKKILSSYYLKDQITVGQGIEIDGQHGVVTKIKASSTEVETQDGTLVIPNDQFIEKIYSKLN